MVWGRGGDQSTVWIQAPQTQKYVWSSSKTLASVTPTNSFSLGFQNIPCHLSNWEKKLWWKERWQKQKSGSPWRETQLDRGTEMHTPKESIYHRLSPVWIVCIESSATVVCVLRPGSKSQRKQGWYPMCPVLYGSINNMMIILMKLVKHPL